MPFPIMIFMIDVENYSEWCFMIVPCKQQHLFKWDGSYIGLFYSTGALKALYITCLFQPSTHMCIRTCIIYEIYIYYPIIGPNEKCFLFIHTHIWMDAFEHLGVRYLAQQYFGISRDQTTNFPLNRWPALHPEPQPPSANKIKGKFHPFPKICGHSWKHLIHDWLLQDASTIVVQ